MKKLISLIFCLFIFSSSSFALVEIDITRGNLDPLPIAVSPLYIEQGSKDIKQNGKIIKNVGEEISQVIEEKWLGRISYSEALEIQNRFVTDRLENKVNDTILLLEHEPVYTIGRTRDKSSLQKEASDLPYPVFETNRGGQATYHGPGQLVGYPILDLKLYKKDLHIYLRSLEKALIDACNQFKIKATTRKGLTGVWCSNRKIASIGVGVRHWISMHGFAINVSGDLSPFKEIIPCGISDVEMTSIHHESGNKMSVEDFSKIVSKSIKNELLILLSK